MDSRMKLRISLILFASIVTVILAFTMAEFARYQNIHGSFEGYCKYRGLEIVNKSADHGYCIDIKGNSYKIVKKYKGWYPEDNLPWAPLD